MEVRIFRDGNAIRIKPASPRIVALLEEHLTYTKLKHLMTWEEKREHGSHVAFETVPCYEVRKFRSGPQAVCCAGFLPRITAVLKEDGHSVRFKLLRGHQRQASGFTPVNVQGSTPCNVGGSYLRYQGERVLYLVEAKPG